MTAADSITCEGLWLRTEMKHSIPGLALRVDVYY